jgi:hypothetical protein
VHVLQLFFSLKKEVIGVEAGESVENCRGTVAEAGFAV